MKEPKFVHVLTIQHRHGVVIRVGNLEVDCLSDLYQVSYEEDGDGR